MGKITPEGVFTGYWVGSPGPFEIVAGPDGNIWFTEYWGPNVNRITPDGTLTRFPISSGIGTRGITAGKDGNIWFTEPQNNKIGRITPDGVMTEYPIPTPNSWPCYITSGPDGTLWFSELLGGKIWRITMTYQFDGFYQPVDNPPTLNTVKNGSTVPIKWNLFTDSKVNLCDENCPFDWKINIVGDGYADTAPVGSYPMGVSPYGALDMAGNVWEWVKDYYYENYYLTGPTNNPLGPVSGETRVLRGGSCFSSVRVANRSSNLDPDSHHFDIGFRCVRSP